MALARGGKRLHCPKAGTGPGKACDSKNRLPRFPMPTEERIIDRISKALNRYWSEHSTKGEVLVLHPADHVEYLSLVREEAINPKTFQNSFGGASIECSAKLQPGQVLVCTRQEYGQGYDDGPAPSGGSSGLRS